MIICKMFPGDEDDELKGAQHAAYMDTLGVLMRRARDRWFEHAQLRHIHTFLNRLVETQQRFDHRHVQGAHDLMAAWYRYSMRHPVQPALLRVESTRAQLRSDWEAWANTEIGQILSDDRILLALLRSVVYRVIGPAMDAENELQFHLRQRYAAMLVESSESREASKRGSS